MKFTKKDLETGIALREEYMSLWESGLSRIEFRDWCKDQIVKREIRARQFRCLKNTSPFERYSIGMEVYELDMPSQWPAEDFPKHWELVELDAEIPNITKDQVIGELNGIVGLNHGAAIRSGIKHLVWALENSELI